MNKIKKHFCSFAAILMLACSVGASDKPRTSIVTSFYPIYIATLNIAGNVPGVTVSNMTKPITGCLHDYQMTPDDMKMLSGSSVFVINGAGMESFIEKAMKELKNLKVVDASKGIKLISEKSEHGDHSHENANPHIWVSISCNIQQVKNIEEGLAAADPSNADKYRKNATEYIVKLEVLKKKMHEALKDMKNRKIITFHEAFPYFAEEFNLEIAAVIEREPGSEPSAKELVDTIKIIKAAGIKVLFTEPQYPAKSAETISRETDAKIFVLDPAVTGPMKADAYLSIMEKNLEVLKKALGK